ncbi:MAG TPA: hypothetical protein VFP70_12660 [Burkholderiales bacterium]|nr:hypothetical protein [Burkholderiales bacterium]
MATEAKLIITAQDATARAFASVRNSLASVNGLLGAFGVALSAGAVVAFTRNAIDMAARLDDLAEATGGTVEGLSRLANVAKVSGTDLDTVQRALLELNKAASGMGGADAAAALKAIGVSLKDLQGLSADQRLEAVAQAFNRFEDGTGKSAAALAIFKRQAAEVLPFLKDLANDGTTVGTVSAEMAAQAEAVTKAWNAVALSAEKAGISIAEGLLPWLKDMLEQMAAGIKIAGGFWAAVFNFGFIGTGTETLRELRTELDGLLQRKGQMEGLFLVDPELDARIAKVRQQIEFLKFLQQQDALRGAAGDTPGERARMRGGDVQFSSTEAAAGATRKLRDKSEKLRQTYRDMLEAWNPLALRWEEDLAKSTDLTRGQIDQYVLAAEQILGMDAAWLKYQADIEAAAAGTATVTEQLVETNDIARELGMTFSSAFEDAVIEGKKFSEVLKGLADDIGRLILRKSITEPLAAGASAALGGFGEWLKGIFRADGGPVAAGRPYIVGEAGPELMVPSSAGTVIPNGDFGGATQNVIYNFSVNTTSLDPRAAAGVILAHRDMILGMVRDAHNRAGRRTAFAS